MADTVKKHSRARDACLRIQPASEPVQDPVTSTRRLKGGSMDRKYSRKDGFTLIASAACALMVFGMAGLAVDIGRMYITKNEAQSFADSAALFAALQLDGSTGGITNADSAVANNVNKWN